MGQTREQKIIKQISGTPTTQLRTPIATGMFLPNQSGVSDKSIKRLNNIRHAKYFSSIQAAVDDLLGSGGTVFVDAGTYTITTPIILTEGIVIDGEGDNSIIKKTGNIDVFQAETGANNITVKNICIDNEGKSGSSIDFCDNGECLNILIDNVHFIDNDDRTVRIDGKNTTIQNCFFDNVMHGLGLQKHLDSSDSYEMKIINNKIVNETYSDPPPSTEYGEGIEINVHGNASILITGNRIIGFGEDGIDCNARYATITGNHITMPSTETRTSIGITLSTEAVVHCRISCVGNVIDGINATAGIGILCTSSLNTASLVGNQIIGEGGASKGLRIHANADDVSVIGNAFYNCGTNIDDGGSGTIILGNIGETSDTLLDHDLTTTGTLYLPGLKKIDGTTPAADGDALKFEITTGRIYGG
jgi:hypothetical protein